LTSLLRQSRFWRADWFAGVAIVVTVVILDLTTDVIGTLERRFYDCASTTTARQPSDQIVIIAIDEQSLASLGPWPWPRAIDARLIDQLAAAKAKVIVHTGFFFAPQLDPGLRFIRQMKDVLASAADPASAPPAAMQQQLAGLVAEAEVTLDTDGRLADSFKKAGNVIIPSLLTPGQRPIERLAIAAAGVGHLKLPPDRDGTVRHETLLLSADGKAEPSVALLAAAMSLNLTAADIRAKAGQSVQLGTVRIKTDETARMLPLFSQGRGGRPAFVLDSFDDVLAGKVPASKYRDKIVVIGVTAAGVGQSFAVPGNPAVSPAQAVAHSISSILTQHFLVQPPWGRWVTLAGLLLVGTYLVAALPRLSWRMAALLTSALLAVLLGAEFALLSFMGVWFKLIFPAMLLIIGHLALMGKRLLTKTAASPKVGEEPAETQRMMGLALQGQGQLDMAFDCFRQAPMGPALTVDLQHLALDFQRRRQFKQAAAVQQHMVVHQQGNTDDDRNTSLSPTPDRLPPGASLMLGRYQVERELGRGAMGAVYLGKDSKIGRFVAIKTMALSEEFEGAALLDARKRFFREAETAGRLQHPHIVTIFDVGEEQDLAYIAMEFLKGKDLADFCKSGQLLPVPTVLSIVARVAEALAYAHRQQVVHRDIKPANIMFDPASDTVKVTDFGIARITDSSKTKTGLVLGTPSFMSPEQLAGKKVDGRSDLYSLGVMLFQMLSGVLPFRGDSLAALLHKIANEAAPDIRTVRPGLPEKLASLVAVSLGKRPQDRYQEGSQFAQDLRAVLSGGNAIDLDL
jgi:CHASE2 domain-containing sensor protein